MCNTEEEDNGDDHVITCRVCSKALAPFHSVLSHKISVFSAAVYAYQLEDTLPHHGEEGGCWLYSATNPGQHRFDVFRVDCHQGGSADAWRDITLKIESQRYDPSHSWFPGYEWCMVMCSSCNAHVGWGFSPIPPAPAPKEEEKEHEEDDKKEKEGEQKVDEDDAEKKPAALSSKQEDERGAADDDDDAPTGTDADDVKETSKPTEGDDDDDDDAKEVTSQQEEANEEPSADAPPATSQSTAPSASARNSPDASETATPSSTSRETTSSGSSRATTEQQHESKVPAFIGMIFANIRAAQMTSDEWTTYLQRRGSLTARSGVELLRSAWPAAPDHLRRTILRAIEKVYREFKTEIAIVQSSPLSDVSTGERPPGERPPGEEGQQESAAASAQATNTEDSDETKNTTDDDRKSSATSSPSPGLKTSTEPPTPVSPMPNASTHNTNKRDDDDGDDDDDDGASKPEEASPSSHNELSNDAAPPAESSSSSHPQQQEHEQEPSRNEEHEDKQGTRVNQESAGEEYTADPHQIATAARRAMRIWQIMSERLYPFLWAAASFVQRRRARAEAGENMDDAEEDIPFFRHAIEPEYVAAQSETEETVVERSVAQRPYVRSVIFSLPLRSASVSPAAGVGSDDDHEGEVPAVAPAAAASSGDDRHEEDHPNTDSAEEPPSSSPSISRRGVKKQMSVDEIASARRDLLCLEMLVAFVERWKQIVEAAVAEEERRQAEERQRLRRLFAAAIHENEEERVVFDQDAVEEREQQHEGEEHDEEWEDDEEHDIDDVE